MKNLLSAGLVCTFQSYNVVFQKQDLVITSDDQVMAQGKMQSNNIYRLFFRVTIEHMIKKGIVDSAEKNRAW